MGRQFDAKRFSSGPRKCHFIVEVLGVKYCSNAPCARCHFLEQFDPLSRHLIREKRDAREILGGPSKRGGYFRSHRAVAYSTYDRDVAFARFEQRLDNVPANSQQNGGLVRDKFSSQFGKSVRYTVGIAEDDFNIATVNEPDLSKCVLQRLINRSQ